MTRILKRRVRGNEELMRKRLWTLMMSVAVTGILLAGCGDSNGDEAEIANVADSGETDTTFDESIIFAKVTAVEDNKITYEILERDESAAPDGERPEVPEGSAAPDGERPEMPEGSAAPDGERPEMPEGSAAPNGERADGMRGFQSTGETGVLDADGSTVICFMGSEGDSETASVSDISEGTMLQIQYAEDGSVEKIIIPKREEKKDISDSEQEKNE